MAVNRADLEAVFGSGGEAVKGRAVVQADEAVVVNCLNPLVRVQRVEPGAEHVAAGQAVMAAAALPASTHFQVQDGHHASGFPAGVDDLGIDIAALESNGPIKESRSPFDYTG